MQPTSAQATMFLAAMQLLSCPSCGAPWKKTLLGEGRTLAEDLPDRLDPKRTSTHARAANWRTKGERGTSSLAICDVMEGRTPTRTGHPLDLDDLRRCVLLLGHVPEWQAKMALMGPLSPEWARLALGWAEIIGDFEAESEGYEAHAPRAAQRLADAIAGREPSERTG